MSSFYELCICWGAELQRKVFGGLKLEFRPNLIFAALRAVQSGFWCFGSCGGFVGQGGGLVLSVFKKQKKKRYQQNWNKSSARGIVALSLDLVFSPGGHWCLSEKGSDAEGLLPLRRDSQGPLRSELVPVFSQDGNARRNLSTCHLRKGRSCFPLSSHWHQLCSAGAVLLG